VPAVLAILQDVHPALFTYRCTIKSESRPSVVQLAAQGAVDAEMMTDTLGRHGKVNPGDKNVA
jgi:hypothetical protein